MSLSARMPELGAFEVLLAVSQTGSLNAAARELGVTQQAVSARVASLESRTGIRLLTRTAQGSSLTATGRVVAEWADKLLRVAGDVDAGLAALRTDRRSKVRISASLTIAEQLMPGWLVSFQAAAARTGATAARVVLTAANSDHVVDDVRSGKAELGFIEGPLPPRGVRTRVVGHDELALVVAPDHAWSRRTRPVGAAELARTPLVTREAGSGTRDALETALRQTLGPATELAAPVLELSTAAAIRAAVIAGAGPAVLSRLAIADDLESRRLVEVKVTGVDLHRELRAIWLGDKVPPAGAARDLLAHIAR
jgi:DNA-binding transcriptional LysR family regulator